MKMNKLVHRDWDKFRAKFDNPTNKFEWFCYLLFCIEFDMEKGIERFKDQHHIETNPIKYQDEVIGFQAKFWRNTLSNYKDEIIEILEGTKNKYPEITILYFYTNQEWSQTNESKPPNAYFEIESKASDLEIKIEWRTDSYFESLSLSDKLSHITSHFFLDDFSVFDQIEQQERNNELFLRQIKNELKFNDKTLKINREDEINQIIACEKSLITILGTSGIGKSSIIKSFYEEFSENLPIFIFRATDFNLQRYNDIFECNIDDFNKFYENQDKKYIVIDGAEKLIENTTIQPFVDFLIQLINYNWKIIFTVRENYFENLSISIFDVCDQLPERIVIPKISRKDLTEYSKKLDFELPNEERLLDLLCIPFYLKEFLNHYIKDIGINYNDFKTRLWKTRIENGNSQRGEEFLEFIKLRVQNPSGFFTPNSECRFLNDLIKDEIIYSENSRYYVSHDIYEEWAIERIIDIAFYSCENSSEFLNKIGSFLPIRRVLRLWVNERLETNKELIERFLSDILHNDEIEEYWKDEILTSILRSKNAKQFFLEFDNEFFNNNFQLLKKIINLLQTTCKEIDNEFYKNYNAGDKNIYEMKYVFTKPVGSGWNELISLIYTNIDKFDDREITIIVPIIYDWANSNDSGETTRLCGLIALKIYESKIFRHRSKKQKKIMTIIVFSIKEINSQLETIIEQSLSIDPDSRKYVYNDLLEFIVNDPSSWRVANVLPDTVLRLLEHQWIKIPKDRKTNFYPPRLEIEDRFGIRTDSWTHSPASAFQTPIYDLLSVSPLKTTDFIINFVNRTVEIYAKSGFDQNIHDVSFNIDSKMISQYLSNSLWFMYRGVGSPTSPYLLQSIHMALEKHLLEIGKLLPQDKLETVLKNILLKSQSASITAVIASIVTKYPFKTYNIAKILFKVKEFMKYDESRKINEIQIRLFYSFGNSKRTEMYTNERLETCTENHRNICLQDIFLQYQFVSFEGDDILKPELFRILDDYYEELEDQHDIVWELFLSKMDSRKGTIKAIQQEENTVFEFNPKISEESEEYIQTVRAYLAKQSEFLDLKNWADSICYPSTTSENNKYNNNISKIINDTKKVISIIELINNEDVDTLKEYDSESFLIIYKELPVHVCVALIETHHQELSLENFEFCKEIILTNANRFIEPDYEEIPTDGVQAACSILPLLIELEPKDFDLKALLINAFIYPWENHLRTPDRKMGFQRKLLQDISKKDPELSKKMYYCYSILSDKLDNYFIQQRIEKGYYSLSIKTIFNDFVKLEQQTLYDLITREITINELPEVQNSTLDNLSKELFFINPEEINDKLLSRINKIIYRFFDVLVNKKDEESEYFEDDNFYKSFSNFLLLIDSKTINNYTNELSDNFIPSKFYNELFESLIFEQNEIKRNENFWIIWEFFKNNIIKLSYQDELYKHEKIIQNYLFYLSYFNKEVMWHTFSNENKEFFSDLSSKINPNFLVIAAVSYLVNGIGKVFFDDAYLWLYNLIERHELIEIYEINQFEEQYFNHAISYLEEYIRQYLLINKSILDKQPTTREKIIKILDFLVKYNSEIGFILRDNII